MYIKQVYLTKHTLMCVRDIIIYCYYHLCSAVSAGPAHS